MCTLLLSPYLAKARWICPSINPFLDPKCVFYVGLPRVEPEDKDDEDWQDKECLWVSSFIIVSKALTSFSV